MVSPASGLRHPIPVNPSVSSPAAAAVASLSFIYTFMGTFRVWHLLNLQEAHNEFE